MSLLLGFPGRLGNFFGSDAGVDVASLVHLVNETDPIADQIVLNISVAIVLENHQKFA